VEIVAGARVADAVAAAGGSTRAADLTLVNLAAELRDGEQIVIPGPTSAIPGGVVTGEGSVRINLASVGELEQLPGVGPVLAGRIAAHRDEHGPFAVVEDLLDVSGIGEGKLETLRDSVALP
jgi:competence protein ComEA